MKINSLLENNFSIDSILGIFIQKWRILATFFLLGGVIGAIYSNKSAVFDNHFTLQTDKDSRALDSQEKIQKQLSHLLKNEKINRNFSENYISELNKNQLDSNLLLFSNVEDKAAYLSKYLLELLIEGDGENFTNRNLSIGVDQNTNYFLQFKTKNKLSPKIGEEIAVLFSNRIKYSISEFNSYEKNKILERKKEKILQLQKIIESIDQDERHIHDGKIENKIETFKVYKELQHNHTTTKKAANTSLSFLTEQDTEELQFQNFLQEINPLYSTKADSIKLDSLIREFFTLSHKRKLLREKEAFSLRARNIRKEKFESMITEAMAPLETEQYAIPHILPIDSTMILRSAVGVKNEKSILIVIFAASLGLFFSCLLVLFNKK